MTAHLRDGARALLHAPLADRIAYVRKPRWVGYDAARDALAQLQDLLTRPDHFRMEGLMIVGPYSNGKTMVCEKFVLDHLKMCEREHEPQVAWIVQTNELPGLSHFYTAIIRGMRRVPTKYKNLAALEEQLHEIFTRARPKMLIFDEAHNAFRGRTKDTKGVLAYLRRLGPEYHICPVLVGEVEVKDAVDASDENSSRIDPCPVPRWHYNDEFLALLAALESDIPLAARSHLDRDDIARTVFTLAEGLIGQVVKILTKAAIAAMRRGYPNITLETIIDVRHMPLSSRRQGVSREELL
jgi:SpoVK/Ycf46/Vps4 family AAA+-type ATPase